MENDIYVWKQFWQDKLDQEIRAKIREQGGRMTYDRDFLLRFQCARLMKPTELPESEVVLSQPTEAHHRPPDLKRENSFVPPSLTYNRHFLANGEKNS